jgi:DNA repair protein RecN (Recombination protein N)
LLRELRISNFTLVDDLDIEFREGLNVLTGETGAGKSILLDAIGFLLGMRAGAEVIGKRSPRVMVEGVFSLDRCAEVQERLAGSQLEGESQGELHMAREIRAPGRAVYRINGIACPASLYREIGDLLVDVHGQHEHQSLLHPARHRDLLDRFAGEEANELGREVAKTHAALRRKEQERRDLEALERERIRQMERYNFEADEIDQARLAPGEIDQLQRERSVLANAEKIMSGLRQAYEILDDSERSAVSLLSSVERLCVSLARLDEGKEGLRQAAEEVTVRAQEVAREVRREIESMEMNPRRLEEVEERLHLVRSLMKKYGDTFEEIGAYRKDIAARLDELERAQVMQGSIAGECEILRAKLAEGAARLSKIRSSAAPKLSARVVEELRGLEMRSADFQVAVDSDEEGASGPSGIDRVEFLIATNPGEPRRPLGQVASGGELSRIMLALKTIFADADDVPVLIFDEIDAGLGGRTAQAVAARLKTLAKVRQVLCVTHLPIIAANADVQYHLFKEERGKSARIKARLIEGSEREKEIARMLAGSRITATTLTQARELLTWPPP